jgi:hypothetical protein
VATGGLLEIDGVQTVAGDLVFLKDQTDAKENGFWEAQTGAWNRAAGYEEGSTDCFTQKFIDVADGTTNKGIIFLIANDAYVIGTTGINFKISYLSSSKKAGTAMFRDRNGRLLDMENLVEDNGVSLSALVDESKCRNLLDVLGIRAVHSDDPATVQEATAVFAKIHALNKSNGGVGWAGLRLGDYVDLPSLNDGTTTITWDASYQNLRVQIAGFNVYKHSGDTETTSDHIVFTFRNCPVEHQMNTTDTNTGGYAASALKSYLEGGFKTGLKAVIGDYLLTIRRLISTKGNWAWEDDTVFIPTEREVFGTSVWDEKTYGGGFQAQYPIFRDSSLYKVKKYNGSRMWWWEASSYDGNSSNFCGCYYHGHADRNAASAAGGVAPVFCAA